mgnify:CR=1 FL=1
MNTDVTTARQATAAVKDWLSSRYLDASRVSARTVSFSDLARCSRIFVEVGNWKPNPIAKDLKEYAQIQGFHVTFSGEGICG